MIIEPQYLDLPYLLNLIGSSQPHRFSIHQLSPKIDLNNTKKNRDIKRDIFKISLAIKCYKCQDYGHVAVNCLSPFKIAINDRVLLETPKPDSTISSKVTLMIKKFSVFLSAATTIVSFTVTTVTRPFLSRLYCQHHILCLLYHWSLLLLYVLVTNLFLLYCWHYPLFHCVICLVLNRNSP